MCACRYWVNGGKETQLRSSDRGVIVTKSGRLFIKNCHTDDLWQNGLSSSMIGTYRSPKLDGALEQLVQVPQLAIGVGKQCRLAASKGRQGIGRPFNRSREFGVAAGFREPAEEQPCAIGIGDNRRRPRIGRSSSARLLERQPVEWLVPFEQPLAEQPHRALAYRDCAYLEPPCDCGEVEAPKGIAASGEERRFSSVIDAIGGRRHV